jgi:hypothetical protein
MLNRERCQGHSTQFASISLPSASGPPAWEQTPLSANTFVPRLRSTKCDVLAVDAQTAAGQRSLLQ